MKRALGNPCPVKGCTRHAKPNQLMCWPHWRRVPRAINHAVFDTYRNLARDPQAYRDARDAAISVVEAKEAMERGTPDSGIAAVRGIAVEEGHQGDRNLGADLDASRPTPIHPGVPGDHPCADHDRRTADGQAAEDLNDLSPGRPA